MTAVLRRLQSQVGYIPEKPTGNNLSPWRFSDFLGQQKTEYFQSLVRGHVVLNLEYTVFCSKLANEIISNNARVHSKEYDEELSEQIATALVLSELLTHIYRHYLGVPREVARLEEEQKIYRAWLQRYYQFSEKEATIPGEKENNATQPPGFFTQKVRDTTAWLNWPRLFSVRTRRVFTTLIQIPQVKDFQYLYRFVVFADQFANPVLTYVSWIFYVPRFLVNLILLLKHLIPGPWFEAEEKELSWFTRLQAQLQRRWFELGNDTVWLTGGLLNCFVLTGALAPIGMYLTISLFLFDALWAGLRAFIELGRLKELDSQYARIHEQLTSNGSAAPAEIKELEEYQQALQQRMSFERRRLMLSVISTCASFVGMCLAIPALTNPVITFIGAVIVITITLLTYLKVQELEKQRPANNIRALAEPKYAAILKREGLFNCQDTKDATAVPENEFTTNSGMIIPRMC
ncbi:hypothetical protein [Legionella brunensis]|uniref:Coiled-coil protein n=1 Tax=Legionella brunensis TaxID=29422 RepID=A0A0W0SUG5_9GAMM|nr:hypothetical protein [Legionella brunensis]KTC87016.1 hypothetical protein Lbru_0245 [Legionella brunensis]